MRILHKIKSFLKKKHLIASLTSKPIKKIFWYRDSYEDMLKFKRQQFNTRVAVLGSSPAKWAVDSEFATINRCTNWATAPQSIIDDFRVLKNYHSYLNKDGYVLLFFSHCRALMSDYGDASHFRKYHYILHPILNPFYDEKVYSQLRSEIDYPIYHAIKHPFMILKSFIKFDLLKRIPSNVLKNKMSDIDLEKDSERWMNGWKKEFGKNSFITPLNPNVKDSIEFNKKIILEIAKFCKDRDLQLVFVIPPITNILKKCFSEEFTKEALYNLMAPACNKFNIRILDYLNDREFQESSLFFNSFFLNKRGRKIFTKRLFEDLGLV